MFDFWKPKELISCTPNQQKIFVSQDLHSYQDLVNCSSLIPGTVARQSGRGRIISISACFFLGHVRMPSSSTSRDMHEGLGLLRQSVPFIICLCDHYIRVLTPSISLTKLARPSRCNIRIKSRDCFFVDPVNSWKANGPILIPIFKLRPCD